MSSEKVCAWCEEKIDLMNPPAEVMEAICNGESKDKPWFCSKGCMQAHAEQREDFFPTLDQS